LASVCGGALVFACAVIGLGVSVPLVW
jgi:hypothetical protein